MSDIPNIICLEGVGEFCSDGLSFNVPFSLIQYPAETAFNYLIYKYVLVPLGIEYLRLLIFIVIIAAFVQLLEMIVERFSEKLYYALGIFLPLITVNCAILGIALFMLNKPYSF